MHTPSSKRKRLVAGETEGVTEPGVSAGVGETIKKIPPIVWVIVVLGVIVFVLIAKQKRKV